MASILGYALIALGIIVLLVTFLMGYGLYENLSTQNYIPATGSSGSNITSSISTLTGSLGTTAKETSIIFLQIVILFLFASIGYKITYLGIKLTAGSEEKEEKEKKK